VVKIEYLPAESSDCGGWGIARVHPYTATAQFADSLAPRSGERVRERGSWCRPEIGCQA